MLKPTLKVELDDGTGTFPFDISADVRQADGDRLTLSRGREDTQSAVTAGQLSLSLNNATGKYTYKSTVLATPSPIVVDAKIRVTETINSTAFVRCTDYVKSWPVAWPATVSSFAVVNLSASDAQARAERRPLRSVVEEEILADNPSAYYTLGEPEGSTSAADSSGNQQVLTVVGSGAGVVFGNATGPGTDGLTAVEFAGGKYLAGNLGFAGGLNPLALELAVATTATSGAFIGVLDSLTGTMTGALTVTGAGKLALLQNGSVLGTSSATINDGAVHEVAWVLSNGVGATTQGVYIDGVLDITDSSFDSGSYTLRVGDGYPTVGFVGSVSHVAVFPTGPTAARFVAHDAAMKTGFDGETGTARITRLAGYAGVPVGTLDTSLTNVPFVDFTGSTAWSAIQDVVDAEGGLAYIDGSGNLIFFNRIDAPGKTAPDVSIDSSLVRPDAQPTGDDEDLINYFETTAQGTGVMQVIRDATSEDAHGQYAESKTYLVQTDDEALDRANWIVGNYAEPTTRWPSLTILLHKMTAAQAAAALAIEPGTWLRITGMPSQTPDSTTVDVMVEGISETLAADEWTLTLNVVARSLFQAWILGDSVQGVLDSTTRLGP